MKAKYLNSAHLLDANDKFITTVGEDGVSVYKSSSLRLDRSWALASSKDAPCSIAYDTSRKLYHLATAAKDNRSKSSIFSWHQTSDQPSVKAAATLTKLPFSTSIHSIHPLKHSPTTTTDAATSMMDIDDDNDDEQHDDDTNHLAAAVSEDGSIAVLNNGKVLASMDCPLDKGYKKLLATSLHNNHKNGEKNVITLLAWQTDALHYWQVVITTHTNNNNNNDDDEGATIKLGSRYTLDLPEQGEKEKTLSSSIKPIAGVVIKGKPVVVFSDGTVATYPGVGTTTDGGGGGGGGGGSVGPVTSRKLDSFTTSFKQVGSGNNNNSSTTPANNKKRGHGGGGGGGGNNKEDGTSVLSLSPLTKLNMVAITGRSEEGLIIALVDVSFVCVQRTLNISIDELSSSRDTSKPIKVCHIASRDMLVISVGGGIVVVNVQLQKPTLASMVGCMKLKSVSSLAKNIEEGKGTLKHVEFSMNMPSNKNSSSSSNNAPELEEWVSAAATVNWKVEHNTSLAKAENEAIEALLAKNGSGGGGKSGGNNSKNTTTALQKHVVALVKASKSSGIDISSAVISSLLQACAESGDWVSVKSLLEHQPPRSLTSCPNLAPLLASSHKYGLLDMLLTASNGDILSEDLGAVLSSLLSKPSIDAAHQAQAEQYKAAKHGAEVAVKAAEDAVKKQKNNTEELMTNAACTAACVSGFTPSHLALHSLLTVNIDSGVLLGALYCISASQAVGLLKYLRIWLSHHDGMLRSVFLLDTTSTNSSTVVPRLSTVVEWINLTVDANMTRLMLREDAVGLLSEMKERLVEPQLGEMKGLAAVRGAVEHLQCGAPLAAPVRKRAAERYSVEWFDLTVN